MFGDNKLFLSIAQRKRMFGKYWGISRDFIPGTQPVGVTTIPFEEIDNPPLPPPIDKKMEVGRGKGGWGGVYRGEMDRLKAQVVFLQNNINHIYDRKKQAEPTNWAMDKNGQTMDTDLQ